MRVLILLALSALPCFGHEVRPAYLELSEVQPGLFRVLWKVPVQGARGLPLAPRFPAECGAASPVNTVRGPSFLQERWTIRCPEGLIGRRIAIENLKITLTDALVRLEFLDSGSQTARLKPNAPEFVVPAEPSLGEVARAYFLLGVEHILFGVDHLLFVFALLMIVKGSRKAPPDPLAAQSLGCSHLRHRRAGRLLDTRTHSSLLAAKFHTTGQSCGRKFALCGSCITGACAPPA